MVKILIIYDSKTGNTERMAYAVAEGAKQVEGVEVTVKRVNEVKLEDLLNAHGIIIGSPTYYGQMSAKIKDLIDRTVEIHGKLEGKVGAAFTSSGGIGTGAETTLLSIIQAMLIHGMIIQGRSDDKHYGATVVGTPNEEELEECRELGKRTAELAKKLHK
jgi:NAD(P)H dehydrogenase (quinone)